MKLLNQTPVSRAMDWLLDPHYGLGVLLKNVNVLEWNRQYLRRRLATCGMEVTRTPLPQGVLQSLENREGEPLLFLHGFGVGAIETWSDQLAHFSRNYRVMSPDLFWFGGSLPAQQYAMLTPQEQAEAMLRYLDTRGIEKTHVVGLSFGGYVALHLALQAPERLQSLTLVDCAGVEPLESEKLAMREAFAFAGDDVSRLLIPETTKELKLFLDSVFYEPKYIPEFARQQVLQYDFWVHSQKKRAIARYLQEVFLSEEELCAIELPTKLLWGRYDRLLPLGMAQRMEAWLPNASLVVFDESGHVPPLEQPQEFNRELGSFLRNQS